MVVAGRGRGGRWRIIMSFKWEGERATPYSPAVSFAIRLQMYTSASNEKTEQRTLALLSASTVARTSPGSQVVREAESSITSRETKLATWHIGRRGEAGLLFAHWSETNVSCQDDASQKASGQVE
mmetsp:Transcript_30453/g.93057  ORF Transcript_30453/g.93057 Transcript_30453/m.93057 type:complete len:125 (+) Transcript_30453:773-1147(+)